MSLVYLQSFSILLDGFGTDAGTSRDASFGHAGERLHEWMFQTRWWRENSGQPGGGRGVDDAFARAHDTGIGAEITGAGKLGHPGWHENLAPEGLMG